MSRLLSSEIEIDVLDHVNPVVLFLMKPDHVLIHWFERADETSPRHPAERCCPIDVAHSARHVGAASLHGRANLHDKTPVSVVIIS